MAAVPVSPVGRKTDGHTPSTTKTRTRDLTAETIACHSYATHCAMLMLCQVPHLLMIISCISYADRIRFSNI